MSKEDREKGTRNLGRKQACALSQKLSEKVFQGWKWPARSNPVVRSSETELKMEHWLSLNPRGKRLGVDILSATNAEKKSFLKTTLSRTGTGKEWMVDWIDACLAPSLCILCYTEQYVLLACVSKVCIKGMSYCELFLLDLFLKFIQVDK